MRVAFAVLMTAVAGLKIKDEGTVDCADIDWDIDWENVDWETIDIPDCCNDEDGNEVCWDDLSWDDLSLSDLSLDTDLELAQ